MGIGRSTLETLRYYGINTPLEFAEKKESWVRSHFKLPGLRTWMELNGQPINADACIDCGACEATCPNEAITEA